jgi:hypothetical protein
MDTIKCILGEAKEEEREEPEEREAPAKQPKNAGEEKPVAAPEDSEVDELANLWTTGNKDDVAQRFMSMDNETAVKVVFAIGREGALELARMVDLMIEQAGPEGQSSEEGKGSTEPVAITPPAKEPNTIRDILGNSPEYEEAHLRQFRKDREASHGEGVRQHLRT